MRDWTWSSFSCNSFKHLQREQKGAAVQSLIYTLKHDIIPIALDTFKDDYTCSLPPHSYINMDKNDTAHAAYFVLNEHGRFCLGLLSLSASSLGLWKLVCKSIYQKIEGIGQSKNSWMGRHEFDPTCQFICAVEFRGHKTASALLAYVRWL